MRALRTLLFVGFALAAAPLTAQPPASPSYPLKMSSNHRYLVDQNNVPFLIVGDSPHDIVNMLSLADADFYLTNRQSYGINSLWVEVVCNAYTSCNSDGTTYDGIAPFTTPGDLSTPNPVYFAKLDAVLNLAAAKGITVFLDPTETGGWMSIFRTNGTAKMYAYGQYLGNRYKDFPNIVWLQGNDLQTWRNAGDDALILAVANGIRSQDTHHLQTVQLDYWTSHSLNDPNWAGIIDLDAAYTYYPVYAEVNRAYNEPATLPVFLVEANYEFENNTGSDLATAEVLRRQEYWSILAGALAGHLYGSHWTSLFPNGWQDHVDTPGAAQLEIWKNFFTAYPWYNLVPDQTQSLVTAGYGSYSDNGTIHENDYVTAARTSDGTLAIAYLPTVRTITLDMSQMADPVVTARWFDPSNGTFSTIGSFANAGNQQFRPPNTNHDGDGDWVLVLQVLDLTPPVISGTTVSSITTTSAVINWTTNEPADSQVNYGVTAGYGSASTLNTTLVTSHSVTLTGLSGNTTYHFAVLSKDESSNLATATDKTFTTVNPNAPQITGVTVSNIAATSAVITWTTSAPADSQVSYGLTSSYGSTTALDTTPVTFHAVTLTGLNESTTYHYAVLSKDASGNFATSIDATFSTQDVTPPQISAVTATPTAAAATISWTTNEAADSQTEYGTTTSYGSTTTLDPTPGISHTVNLNGLSVSTTYHYRVKSRDSSGNLSISADFSFTTAASGLVGGYAFNEGTGTSTADASGNGITGTLANGASWGAGKYGSAVQFDGTNDYVDLGNPTGLNVTGSMTISAWIKPGVFPLDDSAVVSRRSNADIGYQLDTTIDQGSRTVGFKLTNASGQLMARYGATALQTGVWYHITGVYDAASQTINVYLNGQPDNGALVGSATNSQQNSTNNVNIGRRPGFSGFEFAGLIDDVRIYSRALLQSEIQSDMNTALGVADTTAPTISAVSATNITASAATVTWTTNEFADSQVEYGTSTSYGSTTTLNTALLTSHSVTLSGLSGQTLYHYRVKSKDGSTNLATSGDATFTTLDGTPPVISGVTAINIVATAATITWTTNENADSQVEYGPTMTYGSTSTLSPTMGLTHSITLSGLTSVIYHYRVKSMDAAGNLATSGDATFTTVLADAPLISPMAASTPGLSLNTAAFFGRGFSVTISGQNFLSGAVVSAGSSGLITNFVSSTELTAEVPATLLTTIGVQNLKVTNPDNQESNVVDFRVLERGDINGNRNISIGDGLVCALTMGGITRPPLPTSVGDLNLSGGNANIGDCLAGALFSGRMNINFSVPTVNSVSPSIAVPGASLTISGTGLSPDNTTGNTMVLFTTTGNRTLRVAPLTASPSSLTVIVPSGAVSGPLQVYRLDAPLGGSEYPLQVAGSPSILALTGVTALSSVAEGNSITLTGLGFDATAANNTVRFTAASGTVTGTVTAVDVAQSTLTLTVPIGAICGPVTVTTGGQTSNARTVAIGSCSLQLTDIWGGGNPGDTLVLEGAGFDVVTPANNIVRFTTSDGGTVIAPVLAAGGTQLHICIPATAVAGSVTVQVGSNTSNALQFVPGGLGP